jgi:hypothetical protein
VHDRPQFPDRHSGVRIRAADWCQLVITAPCDVDEALRAESGVQPTLAASNGIEIVYETFGAPDSRPLLLVVGLGAQMLVWHPDLYAALAAEGFFVVCYDNRDVGLSTHLHDAPPPNLDAAGGGDFSSASYRLDSRTWPTTRLGCSTRSGWTGRMWLAPRSAE